MAELPEASRRALVTGHGVASLAELRAAGMSGDAVRWAVRQGVLHRVRVGVYTTGRGWAAADRLERHRLQVLAIQRLSPTSFAVGLSAAALLGLPLPAGPPAVPEVAQNRVSGSGGAGGRRRSVVRRMARPMPGHVGRLHGARLTSPVRTVVDCCRHLDDGWALAVADAAARFHSVTREQVRRYLEKAPSSPGRARARWIAEHLDARPESPLESLNRAVLILAGYEPEPQVRVQTDRGRYRVDLLDRVNAVVSEADGRGKYEQEERPATPWGDKLRQDALWDSGFEITRFTMADYYSRRSEYLTRYRRAIARAASRRLATASGVIQADKGSDHPAGGR